MLHATLALSRALRSTGGDPKRVLTLLAAADELVRATGAAVFTPLLREERAELTLSRGDRAAAIRGLEGAVELFTSVGATGHVARTEARLAEL